MRFLVLASSVVGALLLTSCTDAVPVKFPEDGRVFSGVWTGSIFENPQPFNVQVGGNRIAISRGPELLVLDASTSQQVSRLGDFSGRVMGVSSNGSRVFEQLGSELRVRDAATLQIIRSLPSGGGSLQVSRDGSRYLSNGGNLIDIRSITDGSRVATLDYSNRSANLSSTGRYVLATGYASGYEYRLFDLDSGQGTALPLLPAAQTSPPLPDIEEWRFSVDDTRLVGLSRNEGSPRLLVWRLRPLALEVILNLTSISNLPSISGSIRDITLAAADGSAGNLFVQSYSDNRLRYSSIPWTLQGVGQTRDVTELFSSFFKSNNSPNEVIMLTAPEAYLLSYLEFDPNSLVEGPLQITATGVARVGSSAWNYRREAATQRLRFEVQTQFISTSEYTISGTASLDGQNFTVSGRGSGGGVRFFGVEAQAVSPTLGINLELTSPTGQKSQLFATQFVSNSQGTTPPRYTGTFSSPTSPGLRVELRRP